MGVMDEPIENGVAKGGVSDEIMPVIDRDLTGDQGGAPPGPVFDDFQDVAALALPEGCQPPVVHDE